jgi:predicted unusual protein kinase regulating ubiquinone biosynthesis (AarF/ABC1/UbiB family)
MKTNINKRIQRFCEISKLGGELLYLQKVKRISQKEIGKVARIKLSEMGPTFIKIGQFVSTREDIFGKDFTSELKYLQDKLDGFPYDIQTKISKDIVYIDPIPIATASIGQVYLAKLSDDNDVVIKIKRPDIDEMIEIDFEALNMMIALTSKLSNKRETMEFQILFEEYYKLLKEEVDFGKEINNIVTFQNIFKDKKFVKVPSPFKHLSDDSTIVMDYVPSIRIDDIDAFDKLGFNKSKIAYKLVELFLDQILNHGIIHIDPHPGNVGITKEGKIVFYDYGMVQKVDIDFKKNFKEILLAIYDRNIDYICDLMISTGIVIVEKEQIPYFKNFILSFLGYIETLNINEFKVNYIDKVDKTEMPFTISSKFLLILRGISILEGICKQLDPGFNYRPIFEEYIETDIFDFNYMERKALKDIDNVRQMPDKVIQNQIMLEVVQKNVQKIETRMSYASNVKQGMMVAMILAFDVVDPPILKIMCALTTIVLLYK